MLGHAVVSGGPGVAAVAYDPLGTLFVQAGRELRAGDQNLAVRLPGLLLTAPTGSPVCD